MESSAKELIAEIDVYLMVNYGRACMEAQSLLRRCRAALQEAAPVPDFKLIAADLYHARQKLEAAERAIERAALQSGESKGKSDGL